MRQTATTVQMLKDSREAGGLAWVTCAQALDRVVAKINAREQAFGESLVKCAGWASRHFTAFAVLAWRLQWICSGDAPHAVSVMEGWWTNRKRTWALRRVNTTVKTRAMSGAVFWWRFRWSVAVEREVEIKIAKAAAAARRNYVLHLIAAMFAAVTGRSKKIQIDRWVLGHRKAAYAHALETRGPILLGLAAARHARLQCRRLDVFRTKQQVIVAMQHIPRLAQLRRYVLAIKSVYKRKKSKMTAKREVLVKKVKKGGAEELWAHLTAPAEAASPTGSKSRLAKSHRGGACSVMDCDDVSRSVFDKESRRRRGVAGRDRVPLVKSPRSHRSERSNRSEDLESINSSRNSINSSSDYASTIRSIERSCTSAPPVLSLLEGSAGWAEADRMRKAGEKAAEKARLRANEFTGGINQEQMDQQVNRILKASGTKKFGRRRNGKELTKLMKQLR